MWALMCEMVGVLWPWTKKAKLDHKKAKIKYFIMIIGITWFYGNNDGGNVILRGPVETWKKNSR